MPTTWIRGRLWLLYSAAGLAVAVGGLRLPDLQASIVYQLTGLSAVVAILAGIRLHRPARRGIWYGLAGGLAVSVAGDVVYSVYVYVLHREPFPSPADALHLASYPILATALLVMIRSRTGGRDRAGLIDALIVTTGLALLLQLGADIVYAGLTTYGGYDGGLLDLGWMTSYLCWGRPPCIHRSACSRRWPRPAASGSAAGACSSWPRPP